VIIFYPPDSFGCLKKKNIEISNRLQRMEFISCHFWLVGYAVEMWFTIGELRHGIQMNIPTNVFQFVLTQEIL